MHLASLVMETESNIEMEEYDACICNSFIYSTDIYTPLFGRVPISTFWLEIFVAYVSLLCCYPNTVQHSLKGYV